MWFLLLFGHNRAFSRMGSLLLCGEMTMGIGYQIRIVLVRPFMHVAEVQKEPWKWMNHHLA